MAHVRSLATLAAVALVLVACDGDRDPVLDPDPPAAADDAADVADDVADDDGGAVDGEEAAAPSEEPVIDPEFADWCTAARSVREATVAMDEIDPTDPASVEGALTQLRERTEAAAPLAPDEIADDVAVSLDLLRRVDDALAAADYDFVRADLSTIAGDDGASEAADDRIEAFNAEACGIPPMADAAADDETASADGPVLDPADGPVRDQTIALLVERGFTEAEAACLFDNIDLNDPDLSTDQEALLALIATCDLDLERLSGLGG